MGVVGWSWVPARVADAVRSFRQTLMNIKIRGETLSIDGVKELSAANADEFRHEVRAAIKEPVRNIEIDLSQALFLDSCGLGALVSVHKAACNLNGTVRLLNPAPPVRQILDLTRMHRIFEIVKC